MSGARKRWLATSAVGEKWLPAASGSLKHFPCPPRRGQEHGLVGPGNSLQEQVQQAVSYLDGARLSVEPQGNCQEQPRKLCNVVIDECQTGGKQEYTNQE